MSKPLTRRKRDLLKAAHKGTLRDITLNSTRVVAVAELIADGLLAQAKDGPVITADGCHAIGKRHDIDLGAIAVVNINTLAPAAQALLIAAVARDDGTEPTDPDAALSTMLTLAIACGMLNKVLNVPPERVMEAIRVGMVAKSHAVDDMPV